MEKIEIKSSDLELLYQNFLDLDVDLSDIHPYFDFGFYQLRDEGLFEQGIINVSNYFQSMANYIATTTTQLQSYGEKLCNIDYSNANKFSDLLVPTIGTCNKKALYNLIGEDVPDGTVNPDPVVGGPTPEEDNPPEIEIGPEPEEDNLPSPDEMPGEEPSFDDGPSMDDGPVPSDESLTPEQAEDALTDLLGKELGEDAMADASITEAVSSIAADSLSSINFDEDPGIDMDVDIDGGPGIDIDLGGE